MKINFANAFKIFYLLLFITLLNGCATKPQSVWYKSGSSEQEFEMERAQCNAQAFSLANGNLYQMVIIQNQCLQGKGWYLTDPNHLANINNELSTERANSRKESQERCVSPEFELIYAKTPCFTGDIDFKYMTDDTKITTNQKLIFVRWREAIDSSTQKTINIEVRLNGNAGKKYANYALSTMKPDNDKNNLDLYNGQITWGQYNSRRKEIYSKVIDFMK